MSEKSCRVNRFFIGLHHPADSFPFLDVMISIRALEKRKSDFKVNRWILDSGAFTEISRYGKWRTEPERYADQINRWMRCGQLSAAATQDMMCEPFIIKKTGLSVERHQEITIERYIKLAAATDGYVMPVLQGYEPEDYLRHLNMYGSLLGFGQWIGVGSVCKRNGDPAVVWEVVGAIKAKRPDLKLHGFGLKITALRDDRICEALDSSDSMSWSKAGRFDGDDDRNDPRLALRYAAKVEKIINRPLFVQPELAGWWG
jgi:hypothetical protein